MRILILFLSIILMSGCAGLSREECLAADWQIIGFEDGAAGRGAERIGSHRRDCAEYGVSPNKAAYDTGYREGILGYCSFDRGRQSAIAGNNRLAVCPSDSDYQSGFEEGLVSFCTYDSGYEFGLAGRHYQSTCPPQPEQDFLEGYGAGKHIYGLRSERWSLKERLDEVIAIREHNEAEQDALKQQMILGENLTSRDRAQILLGIDALRDEDDELEKEEDALTAQIIELETELKAVGESF